MLYISLIHVLEPMLSSRRCASPLLPEYPLFLRIKSWSTVPIEQLSWLRRHAMYERQCSSHGERKKTNKSVLRSFQLWGPVASGFSHEAESTGPGTLPADQGLLQELGMFPPQEPGPNLVPKKDFWGYGATTLKNCHYSAQVSPLFIHVLYIIHHAADRGPTMSSAWFA